MIWGYHDVCIAYYTIHTKGFLEFNFTISNSDFENKPPENLALLKACGPMGACPVCPVLVRP